jgi:hypothetical protein
MKHLLFIATVVCFTCGCQRQDSVLIDQTKVSLDAALKLADGQVEKSLAGTSTRPVAPDQKTAGDPHWQFQQEQMIAAFKALTVADYSKSVRVCTQENRPAMLVRYSCRKDAGYYGAQARLGVLVFLDTGETKWVEGSRPG